ncbi:MAG: GNAT family N-acetyltransferase [Promethearchaeota archaeon]
MEFEYYLMQLVVEIKNSLSEPQKEEVLEIIYEAFEKKITHLELKPKSKEQGLKIFKLSAKFDQGLYAISHSKVVGGVGMSFHKKRFYKFTWDVLRKEFGFWGALGRSLVQKLSLEELQKDEIYIGAIAVSDAYRSKGIGTQLLSAVEKYAMENGFNFITLEVINTNPRAHALYESMGYVDVKERKFGLITKRAGFTSAFKMKKTLTS